MCALNARSFATDRDVKRARVAVDPDVCYAALAITLSTRAHDQISSKTVEISSIYRSVTVVVEIAHVIGSDTCRSEGRARSTFSF